jgi:hypothetical protein
MKLLRALPLLLLACLPDISRAAISVSVGGNAAAAGSASSLAVASVVEASGDRIVHACRWRNATATATVSDGTNTFNQIGSYSDNGSDRYAWWESINVTAGTRTITTTFSAAATFRYCVSLKVSGSDSNASQASTLVSNLAGNWTNATDNATSGNMTPTAQPNAIIGVIGTIYNARTISAGTGFTSLGALANWDTANGDTSLAEWRRTTSTSAAAATFTLSGAEGGFIWGLVVGEAAATPATLSSATPSGTIGTSTSATVGATTDQSSGTLYAVLSTSNNVSTATASQVKAGQNSTGAAASFSGSNTVSTTTPSVTIGSLSAATLYYYAEVQNNTNGDSNVVSGSFTTAAASSIVPKIMQQARLLPANDPNFDAPLVAGVVK